MTQTETLYKRLGGQEALQTAVKKLYHRVLSDPLLSPFFDIRYKDDFKHSQAAFMTTVFAGQHMCTGKRLHDAYSPLVARGWSYKHFDALAWNMALILRDISSDETLIGEIETMIETTRKDILAS